MIRNPINRGIGGVLAAHRQSSIPEIRGGFAQSRSTISKTKKSRTQVRRKKSTKQVPLISRKRSGIKKRKRAASGKRSVDRKRIKNKTKSRGKNKKHSALVVRQKGNPQLLGLH